MSVRLKRRKAGLTSAIGALCLALTAGSLTLLQSPAARAEDHKTAFDFTFTDINGERMPLARYRGHPLLVVNTASFCGYVDQYAGLQRLWAQHREQGLIVIGAPSMDFHQEYSSSEQVKEFCEVNFQISFPMTDLVHVRGPHAHPFFAWAAALSSAPSWNFHKYLFDRDGALVRKYGSETTPEQLVADIAPLLNP